MTIRLNGKVVERTSRNDLHNTFSPKHHKPVYRPGYKQKYLNQLKNNQGLLMALGASLFLNLGILVGSNVRVNHFNAEIATLKERIEAGLQVAVGYADYSGQLETELASCSAKLQEKKLSPKAKAHVKQQPIVAEKIKQVFGSEWAEATELYSRESSLNPLVVNPDGGACGLWQAYPCTKLINQCALSDIDCQLRTGKEYIISRYGSASKALAFHDDHNYY